MSSLAGAPNACLLGVLLVAQTRSGTGAQILFHYPPDPLADDEGQLPETDHTAIDESSSSDSDSESSSDDNVFEVTPSKIREGSHHTHSDRSTVADEDDDEQSGKLSKVRSHEHWQPSWEPLLGIGEEGLVSLLAPGRAWHKRKFELGMNDLVFVGRPAYARENGSWNKRRRKKHKRRQKEQNDESSDSAADQGSEDQTENAEAESKSALTMFHLVFIMNPPPLEHTLRVKDMYDNVVRKLSKVLRTEQSNNDYVWSQADLIQNVKAVHFANRSPTTALYSDLLKRSSLATAIATIYREISASRIAAITLSPEVTISLQIPPLTSTPHLPSLTEPPIQPGLWLTTANEPTTSSDLERASTTSNTQLAKSFTLLLRDPPHKILKDIQSTGGPLPPQLVDFITTLRPSKSFHKISQSTQLPLADIQLLSRHLIYFRRAIAIPPLHHRDTYIVSPNSDLSSLVAASAAFSTNFPMLPSLPRLLSLLSSGPPIPFGTLIPSSDHKEEYYRVLAWLLRGGWVTQLRTFAYVRVSPAIKSAAREHERSEKLAAAHSGLERLDLNPRQQPPKPSNLQNHQNQQQQLSSSNASSLSDCPHPHAHPLHRPSLTSRPSSETTNRSTAAGTTTTAQHNPRHASLIASPLRASPLEASWLSAIHASLLTTDLTDQSLSPTERAELHAAWPQLVKYFNGAEPLEAVAVREGWKRKHAWDLLGRLGIRWGVAPGDERSSAAGAGAGGEDRAVVVTVRHW